MDKRVLTTIDANANRLTEGIRVCEDIARFILRDKKKTEKFKSLRHKSVSAVRRFNGGEKKLALFRNPERDVGKITIKEEAERKDVADIFKANIKRAEESARVLEEFAKLTNSGLSRSFKDVRFELYSLEKNIVKRL